MREITPEICTERAVIITDSFKRTEGEPIAIRRAKALRDILQNVTVKIYEGELIVGNYASTPRGAPIFPETTASWLDAELDTFYTRNVDRVMISDQAKELLRKQILPYWEKKTIQTLMTGYVPEDTQKAWRVEHPVITAENYIRNSIGHIIPSYRVVLEKGFTGIIADIEGQLAALDSSAPDALEKNVFYQSVKTACQAAIVFAQRFSALALNMAHEETNEKRKKELLELARVCEKIPAYPAQSFREALQCFWFEQLILQFEVENWALSTERFDNLIYPYYFKDIQSGIITRDEAQELLECMWIKFFEIVRAYDTLNATYFSGFSIGQILTIGGVDADGHDDTNDLTYLCMEAEDNMRLTQPNLAVRLNKNTPDKFLYRVCQYIAEGTGKPSLFNDEVHIPALLRLNVDIEDARNYGLVGCVEPTPVGNCLGWTSSAMFNLAKCLELALNDGKCRLSGKQIGPSTGDPRSFKSYEHLFEAYCVQTAFFIRHMIVVDNAIDVTHQKHLPAPLMSALVQDCIGKGKDVIQGGAKYNYTGPQGVGVADVADSLAAIKKLVFEEKVLSMGDIVDILESNFSNHHREKKLLENAPKYGNDIDYVDEIAVMVAKNYCRGVEKYTNPRGGRYRPGLYPVSANVPMGMDVGALPSGRLARTPLADGVSPAPGADVNGPTSVIKSVSKLDHMLATNGTLLNQKFNPELLSNKEELMKFMNLIKVYFELGGMHIQFNVVSAETLRDAKLHSENYRNLLVRVAGYSAFYTDLSPMLQDNIIARTEQAGF
jgi:formate C-acetyltransferase